MKTIKNRFSFPTKCALLFALFGFPAFAAWQTPGTPTQQIAAQANTGITTTISDPYFKITSEDVGRAVAEQLVLQAVEPKAEATLNPGTPAVLYTADHPLQIVIHGLQIDPSAKRWQGQANIVANGKTETVKPVAGFYTALIDVPVLTRQLRQHDVIEMSDLATRTIPERQLRKDTVTDAKILLGQSPRAVISADRPIRQSEVTQPVVIKKGDAVEMTYTTPYMHIKATGVALEDGAKGTLIRVKNDKSEKAVSGRVEAAGHIEVNNPQAL